MKLQLRFFLVIVIIASAVSGLLLLQHKFEIDRSQRVLVSELNDHKSYFHNILGLEGKSEQTLSEDYSFWDDMVNFVKTDNLSFAHQNIDSSLSTFGVDADWIYKPDGSLLYHSAATNISSLDSLPLPSSFFTALTANKFAHFYLRNTAGLLEIRAATIVPSDDAKHDTPEQGFWLVGRFVDSDYIANLAALTQSKVVLDSPVSQSTDSFTSNTVSFAISLKDWQNRIVSIIRSSSDVPVIAQLNQLYNREILLIIVFTVVIAAIIILTMWWLVLRPLKVINKAIREQAPRELEHLLRQHTELGNLAQTINEFFDQKVSLAEAEFKKTELEELDKEKAAFLAVAAHELNGPASNVSIFSEYLGFLLRSHATGETIEKQIRRLMHQSRKITMLVKDLRSSSQGNQTIDYHLQDFDFDAFLSEEVDEATFSVKQKLSLNGKTQQKIYSDPDRLGQVVSNLIRNSAKYSPEDSNIIVNSKLESDEIVFSVQDFGSGISEDEQPHIFERFYRSSTVGSIPGLGLGLFISKQIVEKLGGRIWLESNPGKGSIFYVALPLTHKQIDITQQKR